jgi:hypothetical protein
VIYGAYLMPDGRLCAFEPVNAAQQVLLCITTC